MVTESLAGKIIEELTYIQIQEMLETIGEPYDQLLSQDNKQVKIGSNEYNIKLLVELLNHDYISSYRETEYGIIKVNKKRV